MSTPLFKHLFKMSQQIFVIMGLVITSNAFIALLSSGDSAKIETGMGPNNLFMVVSSCFYFAIILIIFPKLPKFMSLLFQNKMLISLLFLVFFSTFWSDVPKITFRRSVALSLTTMFALFIVMNYDEKEFLLLLAWALGINALMSLIFAILFPEIGTHAAGKFTGLWRGVFPQKQVLGQIMTLGCIVFSIIGLQQGKYQGISWSFFGLCAFILIMSGSRTGFIIAASVFMILFIIKLSKKFKYENATALGVIIFLLIFGTIMLLFSNAEIVTTFFGKETTLSGRTGIWENTLKFCYDRFWLGYGYRSFWLGELGKYSSRFAYYVNHVPVNAHNSLIDIWLEIGIFGLFIFISIFYRLAWNSIQLFWNSQEEHLLWYPIFIVYYFLLGSVATISLAQNNIMWVLFVTNLFYVLHRSPKSNLA